MDPGVPYENKTNLKIVKTGLQDSSCNDCVKTQLKTTNKERKSPHVTAKSVPIQTITDDNKNLDPGVPSEKKS